MADHRATRAGHPDSIVLEPGIQLAAVFMLADEGLEGGAKYIGALPVRFTVMHSCAPHVRKSVSLAGWRSESRYWAFLPAAVVNGRPMTSHSPASSFEAVAALEMYGQDARKGTGHQIAPSYDFSNAHPVQDRVVWSHWRTPGSLAQAGGRILKRSSAN
jgi:hypothetical protein